MALDQFGHPFRCLHAQIPILMFFVLNFQVVIGCEEVDAGELLTGVLVAWGSFSYRDQVGIAPMFLNFWFSF